MYLLRKYVPWGENKIAQYMRDLWLSDYQVNWVKNYKQFVNISSLSMMPSKWWVEMLTCTVNINVREFNAK